MTEPKAIEQLHAAIDCINSFYDSNFKKLSYLARITLKRIVAELQRLIVNKLGVIDL